jgi:hypothetical protein
MSADLFDTHDVNDTPQHWSDLAERIAANASRESRARGGGGALHWLSRARATSVAAVLVFVAVLLSLSLSRRAFADVTLQRALAPSDEVGKMLVMTDRPPALAAILLRGRPRD